MTDSAPPGAASAANTRDSGPEGAPTAAGVARGSLYKIGASSVTLSLGLLRSILLARILLPEHFGLLSLALVCVSLVGRLLTLGLDRMLIHRESVNDDVLGTYFTLRVGILGLSLALAAAIMPFLGILYPSMPLLGWVVLVLAGVEVLKGFATVQETLLGRDLAFRALATIDIVSSVTMTIVAPLLAWRGWGAWALVAEQASGALARVLSSWFLFRVWDPRFAWNSDIARWFWRLGRPTWGATNLAFLLDRFDDFWVGTALGDAPLGFYARAYDLARYPRRVIANPLVGVFGPVFARLQRDRLRLSQAFYRAAHVILRSGFLISGALALVMPEFIRLIIGERWLPMLVASRLMLVYALLDALLMLCANLLLSQGRPQDLQRSRLVQLAVFLPAVIGGASLWGINGVALAADAMLVVGAVYLARCVRKLVDFSLVRLGALPLMALAIGLCAGWWIELHWRPGSDWLLAGGKTLAFGVLYLGLLVVCERGDYFRGLRWIWSRVRTQTGLAAG